MASDNAAAKPLSMQVSELQQTVKDQQAMLETMLKRGPVHSTGDSEADAKVPAMSEALIKSFLGVSRPDCEFFHLSCPNYEMRVFYDRPQIADGRTQARTPSLWISMTRWTGPGSEFKPDTPNFRTSDPTRRIGFWSAVNSPLVTVTNEDIDRFHLLAPSATKAERNSLIRAGVYTMEETIKQIMGSSDFLNHVFIAGEAYKILLAADYEKRNAVAKAEKTAQESYNRLQATLRAGVNVTSSAV